MTSTSPIRKLWMLLKADKQEVYSIYLFAIMNGIIQLSLPLGTQAIIGFVQGGTFVTSLVVLIVAVIVGVFLSGLMQLQQMRITERMQQKIFHYYAFLFKENTLLTDLKKSDNLYFPELMNRFLDVSTLQKSLTKILLDIPIASIQLVLGLMIISFFHPLFLWLIVIMLIIVVTVFYFTSKKGFESSIKESSAKYEVTGWLEEIARTVHVFKMNRNFSLSSNTMDEKLTKYLFFRTQHFKILLFQFKNLIFLKIMITSMMLTFGTYLLLNQELNIGQFVASEIIILTMIGSVEKIISNLDSYYDILTALEKLNVTEDQPKESTSDFTFQSQNHAGMLVELNNVSFGYDEQNMILQHLDVQIKPNEKIAISGADGAGKSTLIRLLSTIYSPTSGSILMNEIPIHHYSLDELRSHIGLMFNRLDIFQGSVLDNITLGNKNIQLPEIRAFAKRIGLDQYINTCPEGYNTVLDTIGKRLPRTIIKKIIFLRAIIDQRPFIILEEPFTELEETAKLQIQDIILNELQHSTIIIVSNDADFGKKCSRNFHLKEGSLFINSNR